jgi:multidrug transporter EmrE-like cation transporter
MLGILLQGIATFFQEISGSLGKWMVARHEESYFSLGFQTSVLSLVFFVGYVALNTTRWHLDPRTYPTLALLCVLEMLQGWGTMKATVVAERSTLNFVRVGTMPVTLGIDLLIGQFISPWQIVGITVIVLALAVLFANHGISKAGLGLLIFTAVNSAVTLSIYHWHVNGYNSVPTEQIMLGLTQTVFFFWGAWHFSRENALKLMARPHALIQSFAYAGGNVLQSYSYLYAPTSIIVTANRSFSALWAIVAGRRVFHEKALAPRLAVLGLIILGIALITR